MALLLLALCLLCGAQAQPPSPFDSVSSKADAVRQLERYDTTIHTQAKVRQCHVCCLCKEHEGFGVRLHTKNATRSGPPFTLTSCVHP